MFLFGKLRGALLVAIAALAGNWAGEYARAITSGEPGYGLRVMHTTPSGQTVVGLNVALTNFLPALLLALLAGRPRVLYAFVGGAIISALVGDSYERAFANWLRGEAQAYAVGRFGF